MQGRDYSVSVDFLKRLFDETLHKVELRVLPNERGGGRPYIESVAACENAAAICEKGDRDGYATYFGACTREGGSDAASVRECPALWVDIDCLKEKLDGQTVIDTLNFLPHPPTIIVNSGGGIHAWWLLEQFADAQAELERLSEALRNLARILAGDMACAEIARIMRLPGTMNSKAATVALYGEPFVCEVMSDNGHVHDLDEIVEWLSSARVLLRGHAKEAVKAVREDDPFCAYARDAGYEPAIDIEEELSAMGSGNIHQTQLRVSMSMIARGYEDDEIVAAVLAATERAAPSDEKWNWRREEDGIRKMISSGRSKALKRAEKLPSSPIRTNGNAALKLVHDADVDPESAPEKRESKSNTVVVGKAAVGVWQDRHGPVLHAAGTTHVYEAGVWVEWEERHAQRLRAIIQEACASLRIEPKTALLNAAKAYFMDRPELHRGEIQFDLHNLLVADDVCLDLTTLQIVPHSPEHYATRKIAACLDGVRAHPALDGFLREAFQDRPEAVDIIAAVQEWFGAAIMPLHLKTRAMLKGLLVHGPSRCGKTQISELARWLLGHDHVCGSRMADLSDRFGREPLIGKRGWIADDAIGEAEILDAETYKVVVTGERTSAMRKGGKNWDGRFGIPVMLTANNMPRVKDQSEATFNRSLILPMTYARPENAPEPSGYISIAEKIGAEELTGLLWWAIEGWQRLAARGMFSPPATMTDATKAFQDDNNPVGAWLKKCIERDPENKVARLDLVASFNGWRQMEHDDAKPWGSNTITRRIKSQMPTLSEVKLNGETCFCGIRVNDEGLFAWQRTKDTAGFEKKPTFSADRTEVNRFWSGPKTKEDDSDDRTPRF